jgi:hypothetical protein
MYTKNIGIPYIYAKKASYDTLRLQIQRGRASLYDTCIYIYIHTYVSHSYYIYIYTHTHIYNTLTLQIQ